MVEYLKNKNHSSREAAAILIGKDSGLRDWRGGSGCGPAALPLESRRMGEAGLQPNVLPHNSGQRRELRAGQPHQGGSHQLASANQVVLLDLCEHFRVRFGGSVLDASHPLSSPSPSDFSTYSSKDLLGRKGVPPKGMEGRAG